MTDTVTLVRTVWADNAEVPEHERVEVTWHVVKHPVIRGIVTYHRERDDAVEHAQRLYQRYGAIVVIDTAHVLP